MTRFPTCMLMILCVLSGVYCDYYCNYFCDLEPVKVYTIYTVRRDGVLTCKEPYHPPEITYTWYKLFPGEGYQPATRDPTVQISGNGAQLSYNSFTLFSMSAEYKCVLGNYEDNDRAKIFRIRMPAIIQTDIEKHPRIYQIPQFSYLMMNCTFQDDLVGDDFQFVWSKVKDDQQIPLPNDPERLYIDISGNLHFTSVLKMDENIIGNSPYRCNARSRRMAGILYGNDAFINVTWGLLSWEKPQLKYKTNDVVVEKYSSVSLECVFEDRSISGAIIRWSRDDGRIITPEHPEKHELLFGSKRLTIHDVQECDQGTYYCEAFNAYGLSDKHPMELRIYCEKH